MVWLGPHKLDFALASMKFGIEPNAARQSRDVQRFIEEQLCLIDIAGPSLRLRRQFLPGPFRIGPGRKFLHPATGAAGDVANSQVASLSAGANAHCFASTTKDCGNDRVGQDPLSTLNS